MRKRVLLAALAAGALLVAPVAGADAKQDGDGGATESKKCDKLVGFKLKGTLEDGSDLDTIDVALISANRHARDWLAENVSDFDLGDLGDEDVDLEGFDVDDGGVDETIKFVGFDATVDFEDADGDLVKVKGKLELPKQGCSEEDAVLEEDAVDVRKVKVKATETD
jgi:hypothetical protein